MGKNLIQCNQIKFFSYLLLALLLTFNLFACGSSVGEDTSGGGVSSYTISGMGYTITGTSFQITNILSISASGSDGEFLFYDANKRVDFKSTSINIISVSDGSATISGDMAIKEQGGSLAPGFSYEITITDGDPDDLIIKVFNPGGSLFIDLSSDIDTITSNFTITAI